MQSQFWYALLMKRFHITVYYRIRTEFLDLVHRKPETTQALPHRQVCQFILYLSDIIRFWVMLDNGSIFCYIGDRQSPFPSIYNSNYRTNGDMKSLSMYKIICKFITLANIPCLCREINSFVLSSSDGYRLYPAANVTPRKRSEITMDAQSLRSVETHAPPPTDPQLNKKLTG